MSDCPSVTVAEIDRQARLGWPDFHPEAFCHRCGRPNGCWFADSDSWNRATANNPDGRDVILCPPCFFAAWENATGLTACWEIRPSVQTLHRLVASDPS